MKFPYLGRKRQRKGLKQGQQMELGVSSGGGRSTYPRSRHEDRAYVQPVIGGDTFGGGSAGHGADCGPSVADSGPACGDGGGGGGGGGD